MNIFKVGDKVVFKSEYDNVRQNTFIRVFGSRVGDIYKVKKGNEGGNVFVRIKSAAGHENIAHVSLLLPAPEIIVIRRDGNSVIAERRCKKQVLASASAKCNPADEFDFDTGARLAFDRLMGDEPKAEEQPKKEKKLVLKSTDGFNIFKGIVGTPTNYTDISGRKLYVGDAVAVMFDNKPYAEQSTVIRSHVFGGWANCPNFWKSFVSGFCDDSDETTGKIEYGNKKALLLLEKKWETLKEGDITLDGDFQVFLEDVPDDYEEQSC